MSAIRTLIQLTRLSNMAARFAEDHHSENPENPKLFRMVLWAVIVLIILLAIAYASGWMKNFNGNKSWIGIVALLILGAVIMHRRNKYSDKTNIHSKTQLL